MLRRVLLVLGIAGLVAAGICVLARAYGAALYFLIQGLALTLGILLERWRYVHKVTRSKGRWQSTGERFVDPTSGKLTEVYYNPDTGERDYQEQGPAR
ncbi:MAG: hypothetical protein KGK44_02675 [Gammaproteobacteria bacterium]|nr:hypothetical protein [Gammaproteobacteria bacterium]